MADKEPSKAPKKPLKNKAGVNKAKVPSTSEPEPDKMVVLQLCDEFYRDRVYQMMVILLCMAIVFSVYVFLLYYRFSHRPKPVYFEAQRLELVTELSDGKSINQYRMIKPVDLDDPFIEQSAVFIWVNQGLADIFSFNFQNLDKHFEEMTKYFTEDGWAEFRKELGTSKLLKEVSRGRYIVNAQAVSPPLLERQGTYKDRFEWHLDVEMYVRYRSSLNENRQRWKIKVIVVRAPVSEQYARGVAIDYIKVEDVRASI